MGRETVSLLTASSATQSVSRHRSLGGWRVSSRYAGSIVKGEKFGDLPVQQTLKLAIYLKCGNG
jgi:hypothetical protein